MRRNKGSPQIRSPTAHAFHGKSPALGQTTWNRAFFVAQFHCKGG